MKDTLEIKNQDILRLLTEFETSLKILLGDNLIKIILYGSYARDDQDRESDLDVMILVLAESEITKPTMEAIDELTFDLSLKNDLILSPIIEEYQKYKEYIHYIPFYTNVAREGIVIYG